MSTLGAKIEFNTLCEGLERIQKLKRANEKFEELRKFLQNCRELGNKLRSENKDADVSLYPILRLLLPKLERDRGPHGIREQSLTALYKRIFCLGKDALYPRNQPNYRTESDGEDFADRVFIAIRNQFQNNHSSISLEEINEFLDSIARKHGSNEKKDSIVLIMAKKLSAFEFKWLTRIILKDLRLSIGKKKTFEAFHPNAEKLFNVTSNLHEVCDRLNVESSVNVEKATIRIFFHVKPMLLERCNVEDVEKLFRGQSLEYFLQLKYDGERSQIHMKDGKFKYFTRMGFDVTKNTSYGERSDSGGFLTNNIMRLLDKNCRSLILDGELMGWHEKKRKFGSKGMSFDVKKLTSNSSFRPCFIAYDIIMYNDKLLIDTPYSERLQILEKLFREEEGILLKAKTIKASNRDFSSYTIKYEFETAQIKHYCTFNSEQIIKFFNESLDIKEEGIVVKKCDGLYQPNVREGSGCYKIKAEYTDGLIQDLDLIILGAYYGDGKAAGKLNSFLVGVADQLTKKGDKPSKFYSVVSVASGLNYEQLNELREIFEHHWQSKCPEGVVEPRKYPPNIWINPAKSIILTVRATEIIRSAVYPLGYSLRFPRVIAVREDKPWYSACTSAEFLSFVKDTGVVQKLSKRHARSSDVKSDEFKKLPRQFVSSPKKIDDRFIGPRKYGIIRLSRLLEGKEFCVINGDEELQGNDIEKLLLAHEAKIVKNPRKETFCVIVGNPKSIKAKNVLKRGLYDVVTTSWLKRAMERKNWSKLIAWYPWEMLSTRPSTKRRISQIYDEFYDSFTDDACEETFQHVLKKSEEAIKDQHFSVANFKSMDKDLFEIVSPFSIFRGITGYFNNPDDSEKFSFRFMTGAVSTDINENVNYIFVQENTFSTFQCYKDFIASRKLEMQIINSKWISECFKQRKLLEVEQYIINVDNFS